MPRFWRITNNFFTGLINRLGVRPPPADGFTLADFVQPVSIVDTDVTIAATITTPLLGTPATIGVSAAPVNNTVLADTGQQVAGNFDVRVVISDDDPGATASFVDVQRRDAGNAANIWSQRYSTFNQNLDFSFRTSLVLNERIRVIKVGNAGGATSYQASIWITPST